MNPIESMTVKERILEHLEKFPEHDDYFARIENTQDGMAQALGLARAHIAIEVRKLYFEGRVKMRLGRIDGGKCRRKAYFAEPNWRRLNSPDQRPLSDALQHLAQAEKILRRLSVRR